MAGSRICAPPPRSPRGRKVAQGVNAIVVPGSGLVKEQAEEEGLDQMFLDAGFEWREPGCSMCLAMNADKLQPGERCASTSNRNFEGRQGRGGRTHLVSPAMAAAAAVTGRLTRRSVSSSSSAHPPHPRRPLAFPRRDARSEKTDRVHIHGRAHGGGDFHCASQARR